MTDPTPAGVSERGRRRQPEPQRGVFSDGAVQIEPHEVHSQRRQAAAAAGPAGPRR